MSAEEEIYTVQDRSQYEIYSIYILISWVRYIMDTLHIQDAW